MRAGEDGIMLVRAELCERLECLRRLSARRGKRDFVESVHAIRALAAAYGLTPVVRLAEAMERTAAEQGAGRFPAALYLDRLQDAIGCEASGEQVSQALIASVSIRLAG